MSTILVGLTCLLIGIFVGVRAEYRNGHLDRRLNKPWPVPQPVSPTVGHDAYIDDCDKFNRAVIKAAYDQRLFAEPERVQ